MNEIWKDVTGFEGLYQVSNRGQVRSLKYEKTRILKPGKDHKGYLHVGLCKDGKEKHFLLHRLVASAFLPNPQNDPCINHKDEVKTNNHVSNLEWCDVRYNNRYGTVLKRRAAKQSKPICQYDENGKFIQKWASATEVKRQLGFHQTSICKCCNGKLKSAHGFVWKYEI